MLTRRSFMGAVAALGALFGVRRKVEKPAEPSAIRIDELRMAMDKLKQQYPVTVTWTMNKDFMAHLDGK